MKISTVTIMAAALMLALPASESLACTVSNWSAATANAQAGNQKGRNSEPAVPRYSGECALKADSAGTSYVTDNTPGTEGTYRARFYVYTGQAANNPKIFSATSGDNGGGTEAFSIALSGTAMAFTVDGTTVASTVPVAASRWYGVEVFYKTGAPFTAKVRGAGAITETVVTSAGNAGAVTVGSARLGVLNAAANTPALAFDAFESTRSDSTEIGRLCPGDANGSGALTSGDATVIFDELPASGVYALGQPDCNESGTITSADATCIFDRFVVPAQRTCTQN